MRTTVDLPDDVYRQLKAKAALEGIQLKQLLLRAARAELSGASTRKRLPPPLIKSTRKGKINPTRKQLEDALFG